MTFKDFGDYQRQRIQKRLKMSDEKGLAYAGTGDRFDNFNRLGVRLSLPREHILLVYLHKHIDAITSTITDKNDGGESIHSRIDDAITYLELLDGMMYENEEHTPEEETPAFSPAAYTAMNVSPPTKYIYRNPEKKG